MHKIIHNKEILDLAHHNTLFSQALSFIPRPVFQKLEHKHKTGRSSRGFGFKEQFTVMAFIQLIRFHLAQSKLQSHAISLLSVLASLASYP